MLHSSLQNPALAVKNIATFFGIPLTEEELQLVVERSSFQSMKKNSEKTHGALGKMLFRKGRELQVVRGGNVTLSRAWAMIWFFFWHSY